LRLVTGVVVQAIRQAARRIGFMRQGYASPERSAQRSRNHRREPRASRMRYNRGMAIEPSSADLERFREQDDGRPLVMAQLLRFSEGGRERYLAYSAAMQPILIKLGAQVLYAGECTLPLLAADGQAWDALVIVRYPSRAAFVEMLGDPVYQAVAHLRRAALREVSLLPMNDWAGR